MYVPPSFRVDDLATLHAFIEAHSFSTLVALDDGEPFASHLPLLLDRTRGTSGVLRGHMARANPQWRTAADRPVLAIFHGPHAYISPTWYESADVVPTWNYVAVHARGRLRLIDDRARLLALVRETVDVYESKLPNPWSLDSQDPGFIDRLLDAIVGFEFDIEQLAGKWKLNQNHSAERRAKVAAQLRQSTSPDARHIADLMDGGTGHERE